MSNGTTRLRYAGEGGTLFTLMLTNVLLTLITFGVYSFWARNKVREFHYRHTEFDGDWFTYHGTGGELFRGYLKAMGILIVLALALGIVTFATGGEAASPWVQFALGAAFYAVLLGLVAFAVNSARRYRLSRSAWRGIRFSYHSDPVDFAVMLVKGAVLTALSLGLYSPVFQNTRRAYLVNHARFGTEPFSYDGESEPLFIAFLKSVALTIPTLGLCWIWYIAFRHRHFWSHTRVVGTPFVSTVTGQDLLGLTVTNILLAIVTFGIASPWIIARTHAFWFERLALDGVVDWSGVLQRAQEAGATADSLADSMDLDVDLAM